MESIDQGVNGGQTFLFRDIGQVGITCGCCRTGMAEQGLDMTKA